MRVKEKCQPYVTYMEISDSNSEFIVVLAARTPSRPYFRVLDKSTCIPEIAMDFQYVWLISYAICLLFSPVTQRWWQQTGILEMLVALQILALMPALGILELRALLWRVGAQGEMCRPAGIPPFGAHGPACGRGLVLLSLLFCFQAKDDDWNRACVPDHRC